MGHHARLRLLIAVAALSICAAVFGASTAQRRAGDADFAERDVAVSVRTAQLEAAAALDLARRHPGAARTRAFFDATQRVHVNLLRAGEGEPSQEARALIARQALLVERWNRWASEDVLDAAGGSRSRQEGETLMAAFLASNARWLDDLRRERQERDAAAARVPVLVIGGLFAMFLLAHVVAVERPARGARRRARRDAELSRALQVARSEPEAYGLIARHVRRAAGAVEVVVLNRNNSADRLEAASALAEDSPLAGRLVGAGPDDCLAVRLAAPHRAGAGDDGLLQCEICGGLPGRSTCVPSLVGGEVIGAVLTLHPRRLPRAIDDEVERSVASAAPVIGNLRNLAMAEARAATDALTGLPNQRTVHEILKRQVAHAGRVGLPLAVVLFDLDHFKQINDTYGHHKGDEVLAAVGDVAAGTVRAADVVGRLGGEEFVAILPDTDREGALRVAENLRARITGIDVSGVGRRITASFGVSALPGDGGDPSTLLRNADRALYAAKAAGRDRVMTAEPTGRSGHDGGGAQVAASGDR